MSYTTPFIDLKKICEIAYRAGTAILALYKNNISPNIQIKSNKTPVTEADLLANEIIREGLLEVTPDIPIISEEAALIPFEIRNQWQQYWLVDPLDGTKEFIHRTDDFTVNIALIEKGKPTIGVIYMPVFNTLYYGQAGHGAFKKFGGQAPQKISTRKFNPQSFIIAISSRHSSEQVNLILEKYKQAAIIRRGSSIKSCLVAEGVVDIYPAFGPMSEWDVGAAQCIVEEAGGAVLDEQNQPMRYNQQSSMLNPRLLVVGDCAHAWQSFFK